MIDRICATCRHWPGDHVTTAKGFVWCTRFRRHVTAADGCRHYQESQSHHRNSAGTRGQQIRPIRLRHRRTARSDHGGAPWST